MWVWGPQLRHPPTLLGVPCTPGGQLEGARGVLLPQTSHREPWLSMSSLCPSSSGSGGDADSMFCFISLDPDQFVAVNGENFKGSELALPGSHWVSWEPPASQQCPWHGFPMATQQPGVLVVGGHGCLLHPHPHTPIPHTHTQHHPPPQKHLFFRCSLSSSGPASPPCFFPLLLINLAPEEEFSL